MAKRSKTQHRVRAIKFWLLTHVVIYLIWALAAVWRLTLRVRMEGSEHWERVRETPITLAFWHGDMAHLALAFAKAGGRGAARRVTMLTSPSRDGILNARFLKLIGCEVAVGSSAKRGVAGLLQLTRALQSGRQAGLAVDGPRGPRHQAKPGAAQLAASTGTHILPFAITSSRCWTLSDWAKTEIPKPFATLTVHLGEPMEVEDVEEGTARLTEILRSLRGEPEGSEEREAG